MDRAKALIGTPEGIVLRDPLQGLIFQVRDAALQVADVNRNIAGDEARALDGVVLRVGSALLADDRLV